MEDREVMLQEYNNLWNEKLIHKQSIRKFHNYLTYFTAIGSLALTFHGISASDIFKASVDPASANYIANHLSDVIYLFLIPLTPILIITLTFPINDIFHVYVIGNQILQIESKINFFSNNGRLLAWESFVCPTVYRGERTMESDDQITNLIKVGDYMLLFPALITICAFSTYISIVYLSQKVSCVIALLYLAIVLYMVGTILFLGLRLSSYISTKGLIAKIIKYRNTVQRLQELS
jgi:hypothetical protein